MASSEVAQRRAADRWFLERGLPAVLRPGALVRRLWPRSAPALAAFAVCMANSILVVLITGKHTIDIDGHPTARSGSSWGCWSCAARRGGGWLAGLANPQRARPHAWCPSFRSAWPAVAGILGGPSPRILTNLVFEGIVIVGALALTACGVGSILGWGLRTADGQPRIHRRPVRSRAAGRPADRAGLLQHLCVVDGVDHQPAPAVAGAAVSRPDRHRVHRLGDRGTGAPDALPETASPQTTTSG